MNSSGKTDPSSKPFPGRLKDWARQVRRDVVALWLAVRDPRVPWYAKAIAAMVAAYALSPIDLIPDFIPVLGYLDDLLIVPLGIIIAVRMIPQAVMQDLREQARDRDRPTSRAGLVLVLVIWLVAAILAARWLLSAI
ncbi:MAG: DUF1232 domain-containing protein [Novosphingobium sp.]|nr:DUF1232 domain-containing protein [Novosphingobium sp.]